MSSSKIHATTYPNIVVSRFLELAQLYEAAAQSEYTSKIESAANIISEAFENGRKLLIFGNGGSASDAQHLAGELVVRFETERRALPAIALSSDSAVLTACANDYSYIDVFSRQIEALGQPGDIALGISTSGKSLNVLRALEVSRQGGLITILMTGEHETTELAVCDLLLAAPARVTARIQEIHLASYHLLCELIDQRFSGR
jgi:D-sedoheptulose 7-phosphate isomerase